MIWHVSSSYIADENEEDIVHFEDLLKAQNFEKLIRAIHGLAQLNEETGQVGVPSISGRFNSMLKECADIVKINAIQSEELTPEEKAAVKESVTDFLYCIEKQWKFEIGTNCEKSRRRIYRNKLDILPSDEDLSLVTKKVEESYQRLTDKLRQNTCEQNFAALTELIIVDILILNRRRPFEVTHATIEEYKNCEKEQDVDYEEDVLTEEEKKTGNTLQIFRVNGKSHKQVPILVTPLMKKGIECLLSVRRRLHILSNENSLLFPKTYTSEPYDGSMVLAEFIKKLPLKKLSHFTCNYQRCTYLK